VINGWQSYGMSMGARASARRFSASQLRGVVCCPNNYYGHDWGLASQSLSRAHGPHSRSDYYDRPKSSYDRGAVSLTFDAGCESVWRRELLMAASAGSRKQIFLLGFSSTNRSWSNAGQSSA